MRMDSGLGGHACLVSARMTASARILRVHGGPDGRGPIRWDFSTNANAVGSCPLALDAVCNADASRYPDPGYRALREQLAQWHGVSRERILLAGSASEFIQRITAVSARLAPGSVAVPTHAYGDYAVAALACGRPLAQSTDRAATLRWHCNPSSPCGHDEPLTSNVAAVTVLDAVYAPLRLDDRQIHDPTCQAVFELHSPNKALGLTGVRGAYVIAPELMDDMESWVAALEQASPSWVLGAHAVAMLTAWSNPDTHRWLAESKSTLRRWKRSQIEMLHAMGAVVNDSVTNFFCVRLPQGCSVEGLRERGIAVRDAASFGLCGWVRLSVQSPEAQTALQAALLESQRAAVPTRTMR